jgi:site-specific DNA-methyltransferase (adenine-specific)
MIDLRLGDCIEVLKTLPDNSVDSIVTDPPYGLSFMGKKWDYDVPSVDVWKECLRVLKPGGHLLSFGGSRTYHRMAVAIEDAGFEVRDQIMWVYGSGFPKSHNIGKAIDKIQGNEREVVGKERSGKTSKAFNDYEYRIEDEIYSTSGEYDKTKGQSEWEGWGTALKPAHEPICMARKPLSEKSIAENVLKHGTGGINIDDCRIGSEERKNQQKNFANGNGGVYKETNSSKDEFVDVNGRFPANIMFDEEAGKILDEQSGITSVTGKRSQKSIDNCIEARKKNKGNSQCDVGGNITKITEYANDKGGASRFFYCPKVSKKERNAGLEDMEETTNRQKGHGLDRICGNCGTSMLKPKDCKCETPDWITPPKKNTHPTVKPIKLMEYLITLVTPKGGTVLEPFMGSGSTGIAAKNLGMSFIGIEREEEYMEIAKRRIENN